MTKRLDHRHRPSPWMIGLAAIGMALTACGTPSATPDASTSVGSAASVATQTDAASATASAAASTDVGSGFAGPDDFCLNTTEQVSAALEVEAVETAGFENPDGGGGGCNYADASGTIVYQISVLTGPETASAFDAYRVAEGAEEVSGIGDAAFSVPLGELLGIAFQKGDVLVSLLPVGTLPINQDEAALRAAVAELAGQAADAV